MATDACPEEQELLELARGTASERRGASLREHIGDCRACRMAVAALASTPSDAPPAPREDAEATRYELERLLGMGGMGEVFVARDTVLGRDVAIKFLREDTSSAESLARTRRRVLREARALASFTHPNVVAVYDQGVLEGRAFLAMEYVRGRTLRQWIAEEKPDRARLTEMLAQAGRGLFAAHEVGLVHRDFKPDNVLVGEDGRARVTDFGLACAAPEALPAPAGVLLGPALTSASAEGTIAGTPAYMAPEQLEGHPADARTDQYAFCVTFYEAIHGVRPGADQAASGAEPAPRAAARPVTDPLDAVLERGLSMTASERFASMRELLADLARASAPTPKKLPPRSLSAALAIAGAVALVTLVTLAFFHRARASAGARTPGPLSSGALAALHGPCSGVSGTCESPLICSYHAGNYCGASGAPGVCVFPPDGCTVKSTVVCGCDGVTYKNNCEAAARGVSSAYRGSCDPCAAGSACADVNAAGTMSPAFCRVDAAASAASPANEAGVPLGVCWPRPSSCAAGGPAVCGWDGLTYENTCEARRAGTDAAREGRCTSERAETPLPSSEDSTVGTGGLSFGEPDEQGMDARPLLSLAKWVRADDLPVYSILVSRHGEVVFELYGPGVTRDDAHYLWSLTSAFTSALMGAAIDRHLVASPETSIADALPADLFPTPADRERFRAVTVRDVLAMSALHAPTSASDKSEETQERLRRFLASPSRLRFALEQPLVPEPGVSHEYSDVTGELATGVLAVATKGTVLHFAEDALFAPLGFGNAQWMHDDAAGLDSGTYGLRLRPVDVQKLGLLYLQQGIFDHKRVLSSDWTRRSFTPVLKSSSSQSRPNFGWSWWTMDFGHVGEQDAGGKPWTAHVATGFRGQRLAVIPDRAIIVTVTGLLPPDDEATIFRRIVRDYVMPSVDGTGAAAAQPDPALRGPLHEELDAIRTAPVSAHFASLRKEHPDTVPSIVPKGRPHRPLRLGP